MTFLTEIADVALIITDVIKAVEGFPINNFNLINVISIESGSC